MDIKKYFYDLTFCIFFCICFFSTSSFAQQNDKYKLLYNGYEWKNNDEEILILVKREERYQIPKGKIKSNRNPKWESFTSDANKTTSENSNTGKSDTIYFEISDTRNEKVFTYNEEIKQKGDYNINLLKVKDSLGWKHEETKDLEQRGLAIKCTCDKSKDTLFFFITPQECKETLNKIVQMNKDDLEKVFEEAITNVQKKDNVVSNIKEDTIIINKKKEELEKLFNKRYKDDSTTIYTMPNKIANEINLLKMDWYMGFSYGKIPKLNEKYYSMIFRFEPSKDLDNFGGFYGDFSILSENFMNNTLGVQGELGIILDSKRWFKNPGLSIFFTYGGIYSESITKKIYDTTKYIWGYKDIKFGIDIYHTCSNFVSDEDLRINFGLFYSNYPRELTKSILFKEQLSHGTGVNIVFEIYIFKVQGGFYPLLQDEPCNGYLNILLNVGKLLKKL